MKCKRCSYHWIPAKNWDDPKNGNLVMVDLGICSKCRNYTSRVRVSTPGDIVDAMIHFGPRFKMVKRTER